MGDVTIRGDAAYVPKGGIIPRANVDARMTPQELHLYNPMDWGRAMIDSQAKDVQNIGIPLRGSNGSVETTINISPNQQQFIKDGQAQGINYSVTVNGKEYQIPKQ